MLGFTRKPEDQEERITGQISLTSLLVCVGILAVAIVNQYLSQQ